MPEHAPMGLPIGTVEVIYSNSSAVSMNLVNSDLFECFHISDATMAASGSLVYDVEVSGTIDLKQPQMEFAKLS